MTKRPTAEEVTQAKDYLAEYRLFPADYDYPEEIMQAVMRLSSLATTTPSVP